MLLDSPSGFLPENRHRLTVDELRPTMGVEFSWSEVAGANSYIFTLYHQGSGGRRQIVQTNPQESSNWTLEELGLLDQGTFIWTVEAVRKNIDNDEIEQRGRVSENSLIVEIPSPAAPEVVNVEFLYEN